MIFESNTGPIFYEDHVSNGAPVVIFTHGAGLNSGMFNDQVTAFKENYRVITWDMQGHGRSAALDKNLDVSQMADALIGIMSALQIDNAVLVGHSLGSWVNQLAAINYSERVIALANIGGEPIDKPVSGFEMLFYKIFLTVSRLMPAIFLYRWTAKSKTTTPGAGHNANMDNPEEFNRIPTEFMNNI
ncbi:MAG: alpha/beta hydrolase [Candidatus Aminicenantales bacterium]